MRKISIFLLAFFVLVQPPSCAALNGASEISPTKRGGELIRSEAALRTLILSYQREDANSFMDMVSYNLYGAYGTYQDLRDSVQSVFDRYEAIALYFNVDKSLREGNQVSMNIKWTMSRVDTFSGLLENLEGYTDLVFLNDEDEGTRLVDISGDRLW